MNKQQEALKLALEVIEAWDRGGNTNDYWRDRFDAITAIREALADSALERMAENARELGLDYEPPCKTGSQCTSKCQQCEQPAKQQEPLTDEEILTYRHMIDWTAEWSYIKFARAIEAAHGIKE